METESNLYTRSKAYVQAAIELLAGQLQKAEPQRLVGLHEWVRTSENTFGVRDVELPYWHKAILSQADVLHALAEYKLLVQAMQADPLVARYFGILVGTSRGGRSFRVEEIADCLIWRLAEKKKGPIFDSVEFDGLYRDFDADIRQDNIEFVGVAPVMGFMSNVFPIRLEPNLEIDHLTDEEIRRCLRINISPGVNLGGTVHLAFPFGVRYRFSQQKRFGELSTDVTELQTEQEALTSKFLDVSHCLRLFKSGRVSIPSLATFTEHWPLDDGTTGGMIEPASTWGSYTLSSQEGQAFQEFWKAFIGARQTRFIDAAMRRFGYAGERFRPEDRLVDLMICAESLFLSDAGETKERGEMRFRLSLRFAVFADLEGYSRLDTFSLMRNAYDARSTIVHGGTLDEDDLRLPNAGKVPLSKFVESTEEALRNTLHKAIQIKPFNKNKLVDWEQLVLGQP